MQNQLPNTVSMYLTSFRRKFYGLLGNTRRTDFRMKACVRQSCPLLYVYTNFGCTHSPIHSPIQIQKRVDATVMQLRYDFFEKIPNRCCHMSWNY